MTHPGWYDRLTRALAERYTIRRPLGSGGMAMVYLAEDLKHHRNVAIKILRPELAAVLGSERFLREIEIAAQLTHPHILPLHDSGETHGLLWYVMPFIEGETLRDRLTRETQLPVDEAVEMASQIADALTYAHSRGVVHRDVKPENILLAAGHAIVADFGIARAVAAVGDARLTETGLAIGTAAYMSPEQASGGHVDGRSDIYSLGCVLYEMLTGAPPFTGPTAQAILARQAHDPVPPLRTVRPSVPEALERTVSRALAKTPPDRFATAAGFAEALAAAGETQRASPSAGAERMSARQLHRRTLVVAAILLGVIGLGVAGLVRSGRLADGRDVTPPGAIRSVAVLPFADLSAAQDQEFFSDGIAEELISALSRLPGLRVMARTSSFAFKGTHADAREIGRRLGVEAALEGSVRTAGDRVRIAAQLIDVKTGFQLWSETYERRMDDVFAIQDNIARAIAAALDVRLTGGPAPLVPRSTADIDAYTLYLKGRYFWNMRTQTGLERAAQYFQQAIARDPALAVAHAGLADTYMMLNVWGYAPPQETIPQAEAAVRRALQLNPDLAEAHASLGLLSIWGAWDWAAADAAFRRAIELNPGYATGYHWYSLYLTAIGRTEESLAAIRHAAELDPLSLIISTILGTRLFFARRYQEAIAQLRSTLELQADYEPARLWLGRGYVAVGRLAEAEAVLDAARRQNPTSPILNAAVSYGYAVMGRDREAQAILEALLARPGDAYVPAYWIAIVYVGLGDRPRALDWLERARRDGDGWLINVRADPAFDGLRGEPRFEALIGRMGFPR